MFHCESTASCLLFKIEKVGLEVVSQMSIYTCILIYIYMFICIYSRHTVTSLITSSVSKYRRKLCE